MAVVSEEIREQAAALVLPFKRMLDGIIAAWVAGQNNRPSAWVFVRQVQAQQEQVHQQRIEVVAQILQRKADAAAAEAAALPEGILQTQVRMPDGTVEARYTVAMLGNDGAPMASRSLHRTLEEALKQVAINERIQSAAAQRSAQQAEEAAQQAETAAARRAAIDPALTGIARAQSARAQTALDKQTRFRDRTVTMRQMLDTLLAEGGKMQVRFSVPNLTRTQYNRMDNREQSAWDRKVLEKGLTPEYELWEPDGTAGYTLNKTEFDYADRGEPLRIKYDYGYLSSHLHDDAERVTREKYPAIFARETTDTATAPAPVKAAPAERYTYAVAETKVSYPWIIEVFGADAFQPFNLIELSNYLEGRTETFEGRVSDGWWMDGLRSLGAIDAAGNVDFAKVRAAYLAATAPAPAPASAEHQTDPEPPMGAYGEYLATLPDKQREKIRKVLESQYAMRESRNAEPIRGTRHSIVEQLLDRQRSMPYRPLEPGVTIEGDSGPLLMNFYGRFKVKPEEHDYALWLHPRLIEAEKAAKNGVDRRSAAPIHYAAIIEGEANRIFALYA